MKLYNEILSWRNNYLPTLKSVIMYAHFNSCETKLHEPENFWTSRFSVVSRQNAQSPAGLCERILSANLYETQRWMTRDINDRENNLLDPRTLRSEYSGRGFISTHIYFGRIEKLVDVWIRWVLREIMFTENFPVMHAWV